MELVTVERMRFRWPGSEEVCLDVPHFAMARGDGVFLFGPSGCGKSTFLALLTGVQTCQHGTVALGGQAWSALRPADRDRFRADRVGYLFQTFNLLPYLSALDNVLLPCRFSPVRAARARQQAGSVRAAGEGLLRRMRLAPALWKQSAARLSVGQQQRVASARALIGSPDLVVADEPTSALDRASKDVFLDLLLSECEQAGSGLILVSHDESLAGRFRRRVALPDLNRARVSEEG